MGRSAGCPESAKDCIVSQDNPGDGRGTGQWGLVALAWALVGVPLLWGVWDTLLKAAKLFK